MRSVQPRLSMGRATLSGPRFRRRSAARRPLRSRGELAAATAPAAVREAISDGLSFFELHMLDQLLSGLMYT